jgi:serine/threonine protein kinase
MLFSFLKLLDVFSSKTNLNLVLEFLDTDLEMIIKDRSLVFLPADIKSWMAMTFRGLEFCHRNFILHRVRVSVSFFRFSIRARSLGSIELT